MDRLPPAPRDPQFIQGDGPGEVRAFDPDAGKLFDDQPRAARQTLYETVAKLAPDAMAELQSLLPKGAAIFQRRLRGETFAQVQDAFVPLMYEVAAWAQRHRLATNMVVLDALCYLVNPASNPTAPLPPVYPPWYADAAEADDRLRRRMTRSPARRLGVERLVRQRVRGDSAEDILTAEGHPEPQRPGAQRRLRKSIHQACEKLDLPPLGRGRPRKTSSPGGAGPTPSPSP